MGHSKIPIFCELKSILGFVTKDNKKKYLIVHYRGNQEIDKEKVNKIIGAKCQKVENETELKNLGLGLGLINPFLGFDRPDILQIFDESLLTQNFIPYTMMTNASHRRWGVEFKLDELIDSLPNKLIEDVIRENTRFEIKKHKIGILTGNSPESGILLWGKINERIRDNFGDDHFLGDISFPEVIIESIPEMGLSMELEERFEDVKEVVEKGITNLCERGATIVCIACNTTQYFSEMSKKICSNFKHEPIYVSIPETTYQYLDKNKIKEFDFLGIDYVSDFGKWSAFKNLNEEFDLYPVEKKHINKINEFAFDVKKKIVTNKSKENFVRFIKKSTNTNTILLALTELSILYNFEEKFIKRNSKEKNYLDTLTILAETIGDMYTEGYLSVMKRSKKIRDGG